MRNIYLLVFAFFIFSTADAQTSASNYSAITKSVPHRSLSTRYQLNQHSSDKAQTKPGLTQATTLPQTKQAYL